MKEGERLLMMEGDRLLQRSPSNERSTLPAHKALTTLLALSCVLAAHSTARRWRADSSAAARLVSSDREIERVDISPRIVVTNDYGGQPMSVSRGMYPNITAVVEPFRDSNLTMDNMVDVGYVVIWSVHDTTSNATVLDGVVSRLAPYAITHMFTGVAHVYVVSAVASYCTRVAHSTCTNATTALRVTCRYVRRELRTLTADDRERYLAALATVFHTREVCHDVS